MYMPGSTFDLLFLNRQREHDVRASIPSFIARDPAPLLDVPPVGGAIQVAAPQVRVTQQRLEPVQASPPEDAIMAEPSGTPPQGPEAEPMDTDNSVPASSSEINVSPSEVPLPSLPEPSAFDAGVDATARPPQGQRHVA
ncbi:hypothetical protein H0H92_014593 [Tricholoma furcatifolium]|nr:hypothetical protein H0H92_014593 [Tricholoma furcatifolium]